MDIQAEKIELAKRLLDTEDKNVIDAIKSVFESFDSEEWGDLPDKVITDVKESVKQIHMGQGIQHSQARETYKKWL